MWSSGWGRIWKNFCWWLQNSIDWLNLVPRVSHLLQGAERLETLGTRLRVIRKMTSAKMVEASHDHCIWSADTLGLKQCTKFLLLLTTYYFYDSYLWDFVFNNSMLDWTRTRMPSRAALRVFSVVNLLACIFKSILRAVKKPFRASLNLLGRN